METDMTSSGPAQSGTAPEVLVVFLRLGLTCFGGPIAHIGYFRREFVERRRWLDDETFADLVGLCQFLPGPASSQVGFSIGLLRAGWLGGLAAWCGFTLPSVLLLLAFAAIAPSLGGPVGEGLIHGLKLVAVAVVAQAVWDMARRLCPDRRRAFIALAAIAVLTVLTTVYAQLIVIALGAALGFVLCPSTASAATVGIQQHAHEFRVSRTAGAVALTLFCVLLFGFRHWHMWALAAPSAFSTASIAPVRSSSAAVMWCCRSCSSKRSQRAGCRRVTFSLVMVLRRQSQALSSHSPLFWAGS